MKEVNHNRMDTRLQDKISAGESKVLEFKEILPQGDKIAKTVIAFSNTSGVNAFYRSVVSNPDN